MGLWIIRLCQFVPRFVSNKDSDTVSALLMSWPMFVLFIFILSFACSSICLEISYINRWAKVEIWGNIVRLSRLNIRVIQIQWKDKDCCGNVRRKLLSSCFQFFDTCPARTAFIRGLLNEVLKYWEVERTSVVWLNNFEYSECGNYSSETGIVRLLFWRLISLLQLLDIWKIRRWTRTGNLPMAEVHISRHFGFPMVRLAYLTSWKVQCDLVRQ